MTALIAALEEEELERLVLAYTPKFRRLLDAAKARIQQTGGVRHEDFWQSIETELPNA